MILPARGSQIDWDLDPNIVSAQDARIVKRTTNTMRSEKFCAVVPIVLTSAVKGTGIGKVHALLCGLPLPDGFARVNPHKQIVVSPLSQVRPSKLFHIEEIFALPKRQVLAPEYAPGISNVGSVLSGHLRYGHLSLGVFLVLGPFD